MTAPPPDPEPPRVPEPPRELEPLGAREPPRDQRGTNVLPPALLPDTLLPLPELLPDEGLNALWAGVGTGTGIGVGTGTGTGVGTE